ncbi:MULTISPECIES: hypothetical protein [unclassified Pseudoalteromonas]|uniref:hypothetical protein n=1 Tax=unclassified Pseudoalteromonas TaxID=194690 RepID=UPI00131A26D1|nr:MULTISPECIES: hypothetical protein [unclassified Pseudoalteromonas]
MLLKRLRVFTLILVCLLLTWLVQAEYSYWQQQRQCVMRCEQLTPVKAAAINDIRYSDSAELCQCSTDGEQAILLN